jgi:hypothetical protein
MSPNERPAPEDVEIYICRRSAPTIERLSKEQKTSQYYLFECDLDKRTLFAGRKLALCRQPEQKIANKQIDRFVRQKNKRVFCRTAAHTARKQTLVVQFPIGDHIYIIRNAWETKKKSLYCIINRFIGATKKLSAYKIRSPMCAAALPHSTRV